MAGKSISEIKVARKAHSEQMAKADKKLEATANAAADTAEKLSKINSELVDIQASLKSAKAEIAHSAERAGGEDITAVQAQENRGTQQVKEIQGITARTESLKEQARTVKPADSRIRDGSEVAAILQSASGELKAESEAGDRAIRESEAQRQRAERRLKDAASLIRR